MSLLGKVDYVVFLFNLYTTLFLSLVWYVAISIIYNSVIVMSGGWILGRIWPLNLLVEGIKGLIGLVSPVIEEKDLSGKVCIVTGGARGIGKRVATYLVNCGATVIIADCLAEEGRILAFKLNTKRKENRGFARYMQIDLEEEESIREFVLRFKYDYDRLDILINNAGIGTLKNSSSELNDKKSDRNSRNSIDTNGSRINRIFKINYIGTFILTESLIPILKNTEGSRIVNTSSPTHRFFGSNFQKIIEYSQMLDNDFAYSASKSALLLYTLKLRRNAMGLGLSESHATEKCMENLDHFPWSTCVNPGSVNTKIFKNVFPYNLIRIFRCFLLDLKKGAETTIFASICPKEQATLYLTPYWLPGNGTWFVDKYADFLSKLALIKRILETSIKNLNLYSNSTGIYIGPHFGVPDLNEDAAMMAELLFEWTQDFVRNRRAMRACRGN